MGNGPNQPKASDFNVQRTHFCRYRQFRAYYDARAVSIVLATHESDTASARENVTQAWNHRSTNHSVVQQIIMVYNWNLKLRDPRNWDEIDLMLIRSLSTKPYLFNRMSPMKFEVDSRFSFVTCFPNLLAYGARNSDKEWSSYHWKCQNRFYLFFRPFFLFKRNSYRNICRLERESTIVITQLSEVTFNNMQK